MASGLEDASAAAVGAGVDEASVVSGGAVSAPSTDGIEVMPTRPARAHEATACTMCAMNQTMKRWVIGGGVVLAALLLAIAILLAVLVSQNAADATQEKYDRARETCEELIGPPSSDNLDEYSECAERLLP